MPLEASFQNVKENPESSLSMLFAISLSGLFTDPMPELLPFFSTDTLVCGGTIESLSLLHYKAALHQAVSNLDGGPCFVIASYVLSHGRVRKVFTHCPTLCRRRLKDIKSTGWLSLSQRLGIV